MKTTTLAKKLARACVFQPVPISHLVQAPLKELFWGIPESSLLHEAQWRIEELLRAAAAVPAPDLLIEEQLPAAA